MHRRPPLSFRARPACASLVTGLLLTLLASAAPALPLLVGFSEQDRIDLGGGLFAFEIGVIANDALDASIAVRMTVEGPVAQQILTDATAIAVNGGPDVDLDSERNTAMLLDAGYDSTIDSFFGDSLLVQFLPPFNGASGGEPQSSGFSFSAASGGGSRIAGNEEVPVGYLVLARDAAYTLRVARGGENFDFEGLLTVPEPSTALLLGTALASLASRRRRTTA